MSSPTEQYPNSKRQQAAFNEVQQVYAGSPRKMGSWMWENHVQWVANMAALLPEKYDAQTDQVYVAALLHDIADIWLEREDSEFDDRCEQEARRILRHAGFSEEEITVILEQIIAPHSCYEDKPLPATLEGKVLATADGLAHLLTDFYYHFEKMGVPTSDQEAFRAWARKKIERDFHRKLFFEDEKKSAQLRYEELKAHFSK